MTIVIGSKEYFPVIEKISYEGPSSTNPLAFKYYDENREVAGKTMKEHFRFAIAYWHSFCNANADPFGAGTRPMPWLESSDPIQQAKDKMDAEMKSEMKETDMTKESMKPKMMPETKDKMGTEMQSEMKEAEMSKESMKPKMMPPTNKIKLIDWASCVTARPTASKSTNMPPPSRQPNTKQLGKDDVDDCGQDEDGDVDPDRTDAHGQQA